MQEFLKDLIVYIPFFMIFMHIVDDFYLQGVLAKLKQKSYWTNADNYPAILQPKIRMGKNRYSADWVPALLMHCISWSFMIHLPFVLLIGSPAVIFVGISFVINAIIHFVVDHLKCNKYVLTLCADQTIHMLQLAVTFAVAAVTILV